MKSKEYANEENWRKAIEEAQKGDRKIRDVLVSENMGLVYMVAKRFQGTGRGVNVYCVIIGNYKETGGGSRPFLCGGDKKVSIALPGNPQ